MEDFTRQALTQAWPACEGQEIVNETWARQDSDDASTSGGVIVEVNVDKEPGEGEVYIFTSGGGFVVNGTVKDTAQRLSVEDWASFELAESGDMVVIRSDKVVALRGGTKSHKGSIGFLHRD